MKFTDVKTIFAALAFALTFPLAWSQTGPPKLSNTRDLERYVGTYPCSNGLLKSKVLLDALKVILQTDYAAYREHMRFSGCGAIEKKTDYLLMDVSQLHVGGYTSMIFVRVSDGQLFLFWLKGTVSDKQYEFYGPRPIPSEVGETVETELNSQWGHVASFAVQGDSVKITLNRDK